MGSRRTSECGQRQKTANTKFSSLTMASDSIRASSRGSTECSSASTAGSMGLEWGWPYAARLWNTIVGKLVPNQRRVQVQRFGSQSPSTSKVDILLIEDSD